MRLITQALDSLVFALAENDLTQPVRLVVKDRMTYDRISQMIREELNTRLVDYNLPRDHPQYMTWRDKLHIEIEQ